MHLQRGQSMVEYTVVVTAVVAALLMTPVSDDLNAIELLLRSVKRNYEGYSYNISGVHYYEPNERAASSAGESSVPFNFQALESTSANIASVDPGPDLLDYEPSPLRSNPSIVTDANGAVIGTVTTNGDVINDSGDVIASVAGGTAIDSYGTQVGYVGYNVIDSTNTVRPIEAFIQKSMNGRVLAVYFGYLLDGVLYDRFTLRRIGEFSSSSVAGGELNLIDGGSVVVTREETVARVFDYNAFITGGARSEIGLSTIRGAGTQTESFDFYEQTAVDGDGLLANDYQFDGAIVIDDLRLGCVCVFENTAAVAAGTPFGILLREQ